MRHRPLVRWIPRLTWTLSPFAASAVLVAFLDAPSWSRPSPWGPLMLVLMSYPLLWCLMWLFVEGPVKALHSRGKLSLFSYSVAALVIGTILGLLGLLAHTTSAASGLGALAILLLCGVAALLVAMPLWWLGDLRSELDP